MAVANVIALLTWDGRWTEVPAEGSATKSTSVDWDGVINQAISANRADGPITFTTAITGRTLWCPVP